jgi:hypothetical protein
VRIPTEQKIRISRDVKFLEEFESNDYEDIISSETLNGRFKLSDLLGNMVNSAIVTARNIAQRLRGFLDIWKEPSKETHLQEESG